MGHVLKDEVRQRHLTVSWLRHKMSEDHLGPKLAINEPDAIKQRR
jgi:hypothetical protein